MVSWAKDFKGQRHRAVHSQNGSIFRCLSVCSVALSMTSANLARYDLCQGVDNSGIPGKLLPPSHGMKVMPTTCFPSGLVSPVGSFAAGKPALVKPCQMISHVWQSNRRKGCVTCCVSRLGPAIYKGIHMEHINRPKAQSNTDYLII